MSTAASKTPTEDSSGVTSADESGVTGAKRTGSRKKDPLIGRTINGRFTVLDVIARGGMGKVYRAEQSPLGRICALKVLNPRYDGEEDPEFQKRFFLEASTAAKLSHANTVTIFDYGRDEDIYYIAMEYIQGRTLYRILRDDGPMDEVRVAHVMKQVARSLREAHGLGVIHRDMKPANVVLIDNADEADTVKVLDFGLVKDTADDSEDLTQQGLFMGSPKYMAPEQILGNTVCAATDVYAIGVVAFELLSGVVPFDEGASVKTLMAHVNDEPPTLYEANKEVRVSPQMEAIVSRCLKKKIEDRYQSMDELLRALTLVQGGGAMTESLRQAPMVPAEIVRAANRTPSWSGPLESGPVSFRPRESSLPEIPAAMTVPDGAPPEESSGTLPSLTGTPLTTPSADEKTEPQKDAKPDAAVVAAAESLELQPNKSSGSKTFAIAAGALALLGAAAFFIFGSNSAPDAPPTPSASVAPPVVANTAPTAAATTATPAATAAPTAVATATATASAEVLPDRVVRVVTDPSNASVKEGQKTLCRRTPCDITFKGENAESGKKHRLIVLKSGYLPLELRLDASAPDIKGKMRRAPVVTPRPQPQTNPQPPPPDGYKESPY